MKNIEFWAFLVLALGLAYVGYHVPQTAFGAF